MLKKWLKRFKENEKGLTLVELLAVIVILAIVGAIAFVSINGVIENSKKDAQIANAMQVISAAELYEASSGKIDGTIATGGETNYDESFASMVGEIVDPWETSNELTASVTRNGDVLEVTIESSGCDIEGETKADLRDGDRDSLCK